MFIYTFFGGGGCLTPFFVGVNIFIRVKLSYAPNYTFLGHLEGPSHFGVVGGGGWSVGV